MNRIGRIIGVLLGWKIGGALGVVVGYFAGHFFDKARVQFKQDYSGAGRAQVERTLFTSIFPMLGHLAKADGRVSESEIQATEQMMAQLRLSPEMRQEAIQLFKAGTSPDFNLETTLAEFLAVCGRYADIKQLTLVYLITLAMADGTLHDAERQCLREVAERLGYSATVFEQLLRMVSAQSHFYQQEGQTYQSANSADELRLAYEALGVESSVGDADLKRAYRKLMSQYHPDKLVGQGVPEDMVKVATERAQEIQTAYDLIKRHRQKS